MTDDLIEIATVLLFDRRGWVLLQERDEGAPSDPDRWSLVGGHIEPGEDPLAAAVRELEEETEIRVAAEELLPFGTRDHRDRAVRFHLFVAPATLTDADVVCHEGRQIVFVDPATLDALDATEITRRVVGELRESPAYVANTTG